MTQREHGETVIFVICSIKFLFRTPENKKFPRTYINQILYFSHLFKNIRDRWVRFSGLSEEDNDDNNDDDNHDDYNIDDDDDNIKKEESESVPTSGRSRRGEGVRPEGAA